MRMKTYIINGLDFSRLDEFFDIISTVLVPGFSWGRNLDAFDEILSGEFGTPETGFVLVWKNSETSRMKLSFEETVRQLSQRVVKCHPSSREIVEKQLQDARSEIGQTVFDWLVEVILDHGPSGSQSADNVALRLE